MLRNTSPALLIFLGTGAPSAQPRLRLTQTLLVDKVELESREQNLALRNLGFPGSTVSDTSDAKAAEPLREDIKLARTDSTQHP